MWRTETTWNTWGLGIVVCFREGHGYSPGVGIAIGPFCIQWERSEIASNIGCGPDCALCFPQPDGPEGLSLKDLTEEMEKEIEASIYNKSK
jgi:hypothetical protein